VHPLVRAASAALAALTALGAAGCTMRAAADYQRPAPASPSAKPSATPAPPPAIPAGARWRTVDGRRYLLYVPKNVARPAPLVVALGGIGFTAQHTLAAFRLTATAAKSHAVVAYPDPVKGIWNAGGCCFGATADDIGFMTRMRAQIAHDIPLDSRRQVMMGYSNGGMLAYDAACADTHWTGIVVLGASLMTRCTPKRAFTIVNVNGENDTVAHWDGGYAHYTQMVMPAVWQIDQEFATVFGCRPVQHAVSNSNEVYTYAGCQGGAYVRDIRVPGLRHHWPMRELDGYDMGPVLWRLVLARSGA